MSIEKIGFRSKQDKLSAFNTLSSNHGVEKVPEVVDAYKEVFGSDAGQIVLKDMAARSYFYNRTTAVGDPYLTYFREGARDTFLITKTICEIENDEISEFSKTIQSNKDTKYVARSGRQRS